MKTLLVITALLLASPTDRPTHAALRKAFEQNADTLVQVSGGRSSGTGVVVGADGHIVTTVDHVGLYEAKVKLGGREVPARVLSANAWLKIAVLTIDSPAKAPAVRADAPLARGAWLVGIQQAKTPTPIAGRIVAGRSRRSPFIVTDLPLPPGSPLFDPRGRLVAIVVERVGRIGSKALPISAVQAQLAAEVTP